MHNQAPSPAPPFPTGSRFAVLPSVWRAYLGIGLLAILTYYQLPASVQGLWYAGLGCATLFAIVSGIRLHRPVQARPWLVFALGQLLIIAGNLAAGPGRFASTAGLLAPTVAHLLYLSAFPILLAGILMVIHARMRGPDRAGAIDAAIIATGVGSIIWALLAGPGLRGSGEVSPERILLAYPLLDTMLLAVLARFMLTPGARSAAFRFLCLGLVFMLGTDIVAASLRLNPASPPGTWLDAGQMLATLSWGVAALHPSMRAVSQPAMALAEETSQRRLALLGAAALLAPALLAGLVIRDLRQDLPVAVAATVVIFVLALARIHGLVRSLTGVAVREQTLR